MITEFIQYNESRSEYLSWKRKNVTIRGVKDIGSENNAGAMLGRGLYTAALSNKELAKQYGKVYFVLNAIPKNPKIFDRLNEWEIWEYNVLVSNYCKDKNVKPSKNYFYNNTTIEDEMLKNGYDGIIIKGREIVNYNPKNILYFSDEFQLENYYNYNIRKNEGVNDDVNEGVNFTIPEKLKKYQDIEGDISNVSEWRTQIILNNNSGKGLKRGDYDKVGYIMINHNTSDIIPISRSDEHHRGDDLLFHFFEKKLINNVNYTPIFSLGNNYVYCDGYNIKKDEKEVKEYLNVVKKFLSYGGKNLPLTIISRKNYKIDFNLFVKLDGDLSNIKEYIESEGELTDNAESLIFYLEQIALMYRAYRLGEDKKLTPKIILDKADKFFNGYYKILNKIDFMNTFRIQKNIDKAIVTFDVELLAKTLFTHNGLKNTIHIMLKEKDQKLKPFFGNLEIALEKFNQLSAI